MKYRERTICGRQISPPHQPCEAECGLLITFLLSQKYNNQKHKMTGKEYNNLPEITEPKCYGLTKKQWIIVSLVLLGILLNIITGLTVYYVFGRNSMKPKSVVTRVFSQVSSPQQRQIDTEFDQISGRSANEEDVTTTACPPVKEPECTEPDCPLNLPPCKDDSLPPCDCVVPPGSVVCPTTPRSMDRMTAQQMVNKRPLDLLRGLPPNSPFDSNKTVYTVKSYERLHVIMDLMENYYEPYYEMFTRRKCDGPMLNSPADERRICPMCSDRYDYLQCLHNHYLIQQFDNIQTTLKEIPEASSVNWNKNAYESSRKGNWGGKSDLQPTDYNMTQFFANRNAMTLIVHPPGTNSGLERCIPCNTDFVNHANCIVEAGNDKPSWNFKTWISRFVPKS